MLSAEAVMKRFENAATVAKHLRDQLPLTQAEVLVYISEFNQGVAEEKAQINLELLKTVVMLEFDDAIEYEAKEAWSALQKVIGGAPHAVMLEVTKDEPEADYEHGDIVDFTGNEGRH